MIAIALQGCAATAERTAFDVEHIKVEKVDSRLARIGLVQLSRTVTGFRVRGELIKKTIGLGPIYGHVHLEAFGVDDDLLAALEAPYRKYSAVSRAAAFTQSLAVAPVATRWIRIEHHTHVQ